MPAPLSSRPAAEAAADIVCRRLGAARRALGRGDVHAFRVAIRRARTTLRAYRALLPDVRRKDRRRLRRLARATNTGRDAEVLLPLLDRFVKALDPAEHRDVARVRRRLRARRRTTEALNADLHDAFRRAARSLRRRLRHAPTSEASFGTFLGVLLGDETPRLAERLEALASSNDQKTLHAARLGVKRVRYLLEPIQRDLTDAASATRELRALQAALGDLHDLDVLVALLDASDPAPGVAALRVLVADHRAERARVTRETWLGPRAASLVACIEAVGRRLRESERVR